MAKKLLEFMVKSLVSRPEVVAVEELDTPGKRVFQVRVSSHDIAKVIGSGGRTFRALRTVMIPVLPADIKDIIVDVAA